MNNIARIGAALLAITALSSIATGCYVAPRRGYYYTQPVQAQPVYVAPARPAVYVQPARPVYVQPAQPVYVAPARY